MWDERYSAEGYVYGTEPNGFLVAKAELLPAGRVLCLAEGEGRNAVWLAEQGFEVTAVDASAVGLHKARALAAERGVRITTVHADLAAFVIEPGSWDGIVSIFCHLPPALRAQVHRRCVAGLRSGGVMLLEAYTPDQVGRGTGGPPSVELMMDAETLRLELTGLEFLELSETEREIHEGVFHNGVGAVVRLVGRKP
ncbi:MAG: class I SAM-dependent methyltransferase [Chromatiaceae bacterium]|jgi:SAM-dependent methyltransferase|nr:class I SAM-dependent methyltransferase [Chromatiaceae bacterium]